MYDFSITIDSKLNFTADNQNKISDDFFLFGNLYGACYKDKILIKKETIELFKENTDDIDKINQQTAEISDN
ncbi:MAG: hypothetical protein GY714_15725 [Desulfobacterales bacterium]|nr:hypothetical protein [Desulfobacterales bacterium]